MAKTALKEEEFSFPAGGIADFYMEDDEITALEKAEAKKTFGDAGIANFEEIASRMASYGRHGDDTVAHVETGELVIPKALIEDNPKLRDSIFSHLEEMGVENPERYVVGSGANSINPETGLPEFFFKAIGKAISGIAKGVSKVIKKVGKVIKKVAPIVLPIALSFTPLGPVYGAALGSGIGTLASGGDLKDAFKSALIAGGTGALFSGFTGKGTFTQNVGKAFADPAGRLSQTLSGAGSTFTGGGFTGQGNLFSQYAPAAGASSVSQQVSAQASQPVDAQLASEEAAGPQTGAGTSVGGSTNAIVTDQVVQASEPSSFMDATKEFLFPASPTADQVALAKKTAYTNAYNNAMTLPGMTTAEAAKVGIAAMNEVTAASMGPGILRKFGPTAALGLAGAAAGGFFDAPPEEEVDIAGIQGPTGADLIAEDPDKYLVAGNTPTGSTGPYSVTTRFGYNPVSGMYNTNPFGTPQYVADGGEIFPRRTGGIMPDEGIPNQDSVRAMLMPGEFVMTTDAVRGLGNGDLRQGINNMYGMMRNLESRGKAMA